MRLMDLLSLSLKIPNTRVRIVSSAVKMTHDVWGILESSWSPLLLDRLLHHGPCVPLDVKIDPTRNVHAVAPDSLMIPKPFDLVPVTYHPYQNPPPVQVFDSEP